ncbi:MAG: hypothetical protein AAB356_06385 [Deltaproteobacteria bacterium]
MRTAYLRNIGTLAKDPVHAAGFVLMKALETLVSAAGNVNTRYKKPKNVYEQA